MSLPQQIASVAAVIQAIDAIQESMNSPNKAPFAGGFALATWSEIDFDRKPPASRQRRCFIMPYQFSGPGKHGRFVAHDILLVIQEEKAKSGAADSFHVYILDSQPSHLKARLNGIYADIQYLVRTLQWPEHRNEDGHVDFDKEPTIVKVTPQSSSTTCGYHTILNAWILALGLTPKVRSNFPVRLYDELRDRCNIALIGDLTWQDLANWLIESGLVIQGNLEDVPESRRFGTTAAQKEDMEDLVSLADYIRTVRDGADHDLARQYESGQYENVVPYDFSNNVDFKNGDWEFEDTSDPGPPKPPSSRKRPCSDPPSDPSSSSKRKKNGDAGGSKSSGSKSSGNSGANGGGKSSGSNQVDKSGEADKRNKVDSNYTSSPCQRYAGKHRALAKEHEER